MLKKTPGMPCPNCGAYIAMSIEDLLSQSSFKCQNPDCNTELHIDRGRSAESMNALEKLKDGLAKASAGQQAAANFGKAAAPSSRPRAAQAPRAAAPSQGVVVGSNQGKPAIVVGPKPIARGGR